MTSPKRNTNHQEPVQRKAYFKGVCIYECSEVRKYSHLVASRKRTNIWLATNLPRIIQSIYPESSQSQALGHIIHQAL